jgi:hypothetical protein
MNTKKRRNTLVRFHVLWSGQVCRSQDTAGSTTPGHGLDGRGVGDRLPVRARFLSSTRHHRSVLEPTQYPIQCVPAAISPGVKRPGCEADNSSLTNVEVKNTWIYTFTPQYVFMV